MKCSTKRSGKRANPEMILISKKIGAMTAPWEDGGNHTYSVGSMVRAGRPVPVDHVWGAIKVYERDLAAAKAKQHGWGPKEARALTSILKGLGAALSLHYEGTIGGPARDALMEGTRRNPRTAKKRDSRATKAVRLVTAALKAGVILHWRGRTPDGRRDDVGTAGPIRHMAKASHSAGNAAFGIFGTPGKMGYDATFDTAFGAADHFVEWFGVGNTIDALKLAAKKHGATYSNLDTSIQWRESAARANPGNAGRPLDWRAGGSHASMRVAPVVSRAGRDRILLVYNTPDGVVDWTIAQGVNAVVWLPEHPEYVRTSGYRDGAEFVHIVHNDAEAERRLAERAAARAARRAARQR